MMVFKGAKSVGQQWVAAQKVQLLIGQCVASDKLNASKLKIRRLELDTNINMYFAKEEYIYVTDPDKKCKTGDLVLAKKLPENLTRLISHEVVEIVHRLGDVICPVTNKKILRRKYRTDVEEERELFGKLESGFDYEKAPPRGWQEGKKDFTDKRITKKFHMFPEDDPYTVYH